MSLAPGVVRDSIIACFLRLGREASIEEITNNVYKDIGSISKSSIRSYLSLNTPGLFERMDRGIYRLSDERRGTTSANLSSQPKIIGKSTIFLDNAIEWLKRQKDNSVHAVVTDPPYGLVEYTKQQTEKLRAGKGGIWRKPPSFDGHKRAPLPRFTVLREEDRQNISRFFTELSLQLERVVVPGGNIVIASNPLLSHIVAEAMSSSGLELRGYIARQVMTMRGGDRPKNAHDEFDGVSVMPRSQWEPWVILRKSLDGRVQDNLRKWKTGGFRRISAEQPFGDVIKSHPTPAHEKKIAPHPSLKPQNFMRKLVRGVLPLGEGIILDPFMGAGSTMAAANHIGYESIGVEIDREFFELAEKAIPTLSTLPSKT
ncbi:TPA: site-specific DNA-methyltransferase [Enterobacter kobei]|uniref:DNA-methyltransferase n=1 Tax=Enterobacter sp. JBIWA003 TaxID=2831890 RepID=UPI001CBF7694|nr:DNA methyltransferase [Enterobacter sp. JBIWA003]UAN22309.1 site-specific DNA-methyltransferase [Enterobacter sp. JBIWA003]HDC4499237.1 site-specific DNA-methyltransferase [Enterobacter kobei]